MQGPGGGSPGHQSRAKFVSSVRLTSLSKHFGNTLAVDDINLDIAEGEFFSMLGPSGCGKSTTLRMIAGFEETSVGTIEIDGNDVSHFPPEERQIGFVFQNYALFPHMNVYDNVAFGLRLRKFAKDAIDSRVRTALVQVGMAGFENRFQREMSGGQQQRIALARVLVTEPRLLLLDEPLSALDKNLREEMKFWIKGLQDDLGITTIYVTHDQGEALTLSDRIAVMHQGRVAQVGTPQEIYEKPVNRFVTAFIGESDILATTVTEIAERAATLDLEGFQIRAPLRAGLAVGGDAHLAVRPERFKVEDRSGEAGWNTVKAIFRKSAYQGAFIRLDCALGAQGIRIELANDPDLVLPEPGQEVSVSWQLQSGWIVED